MRPIDLDADPAWADARWISILDRIEHRQPGVGLRFWGPPLWLEVTMTGPDSDRWPAVGDEATSWDWQSNDTCDVAGLERDGADDDRLLATVARYTIENLALNAVHEIGEWFRFDGRRLFPAHGSAGGDEQGNGAVSLRMTFGAADRGVDQQSLPRPELVARLVDAAAPSRFTYLPGTTVSYDAGGPTIRTWSGAGSVTAWRGAWSRSTSEAVDADDPRLVALIGRDVHAAVVSHEVDRICRAFHVDGRRPWRLLAPGPALGADPPDSEAGAEPLSISISIDHADG